MEYTGKLYGEEGIPLMLTASDVDALESMRSRLCAALGLPADSAPETVAEAVEARRVVVPELTDDEIEERFQSTVNPDIDGVDQDKREWCYKDCRWAYNLATSRTSAIPAGRVLGEGERKVGSEEWMYLSALERYARKHGSESIQDVVGALDHLRANQGGAEHA